MDTDDALAVIAVGLYVVAFGWGLPIWLHVPMPSYIEMFNARRLFECS